MRYTSPVSPEVAGAQIFIEDAGAQASALGFARRQLEIAEEAATPIREMIARTEAGLPEGLFVGTMTSAHHMQASWAKGEKPDDSVGASKIYVPDANGEYRSRAGIITEGKELPFLGSRLLLRGSSLVVVNDEIKFGLSVKRSVFTVEANTDVEREFLSETVPLLKECKPGILNTFIR